MSDEILNDVISRNVSFPYKYFDQPMITVQRNPSNTVKQSFIHDPHDWARYEINWSQLTDAQALSLWEFIKAHGGNRDSFLFRDDFGFGYQVARQVIGTGDGIETEFQLIETFAAGATSTDYERWDIEAATLRIWINSVEVFSPAAWGADLTRSGLVTTVAAVPGAQDIEALYEYDRRVRAVGALGSILSGYENRDFPLVLDGKFNLIEPSSCDRLHKFPRFVGHGLFLRSVSQDRVYPLV